MLDREKVVLPCWGHWFWDWQADEVSEKAEHRNGQDSIEDGLRVIQTIENAQDKRHGHPVHNNVPFVHPIHTNNTRHCHMKQNC